MSAEKCETNVLGHFSFNYRRILIDEIALDGLEGIAILSLWERVEHRITAPLTEKMKCRLWDTIIRINDISLYQVPEPLPKVPILDRFTLIDDESGNLRDPDDYLDGPYEFCPIALMPNECGSSKHYFTRKLIPSALLIHVPYNKVLEEYGDTLVLVASLQKRWQALAQHVPLGTLQQLPVVQYCMLELIGKSRENGQMTTGKTNLTKIIKEPKNLFYVRRTLKNLDLVKVQCITQSQGTKGFKSLLIRLNRFHRPSILSMPKSGKIHKLVEYLRTQPNYMERTEELFKKNMLTPTQSKKLKKRNTHVFDFLEKGPEEDEPVKKKRKLNAPVDKKRRYIVLTSKSDESSESEDEETSEPVKYQYKLGIGLMRQAYERVLDSGSKGVTQSELGQMLGLHFYTCRIICKALKARKIVREYYEDKGKQRRSRYVAVASGHGDTKYLEEQKKFLDHINQSYSDSIDTQTTTTTDTIILDNQTPNKETDTAKASEGHITEVMALNTDRKNLVKTDKALTLRQLKIANGVIKIVKDRQCVTGVQTISNLVAKEINEPPMVTKALNNFLMKLVAAKQIKMYKIKCPGKRSDHVMNLICAPHVKATDPIVENKYKEMCLRALARKPSVKKEVGAQTTKPLTLFINPRYMKIQKLHEAIIKLVYFDDMIVTSYPAGFLSVTDLLPEMSVKFAISNMSNTGMSEIESLRIQDSHLNLKLKDAPPELSHGIMKCKSLKNALRMNLKALAMFGLIQLIYQPNIQTADYVNNTLVSFLFYVNRNAKIINTSGKWPREVNDKRLEASYYFKSFDDVKNYWKDVYDISTNTTITLTEPRSRKTLNAPVRTEDSVPAYDNGDRYGNGKGPCGFDSCFYLEIARLWQTYYAKRGPKPAIPRKKPHIKAPKLSKIKKPKIVKKKPPKVNPVLKMKTAAKGRKRIPESTNEWSTEEDKMLIMCQAAITIASPTSQPGCLRVQNNVAKDILSISDPKKTQYVCHRRILMLQHNPGLIHERDSLLNEMRRRRHLIKKYEGLIKKLRTQYSTNMAKFIQEARLPMLELIWLIWQVSESESYNRKLPCVALHLDAFKENFDIVTSTASKVYNLYKSPELTTIREGVFLTIMLTQNSEIKVKTAKKIYSTFKQFPENSLRTAIDQLRKCGAVSAKEKIFNNQNHRLHLEDIVQSAYKISANYQRRWISRLNSEFVESLSKLISDELRADNIRGSAEINCVLCELYAAGIFDVVTSINLEIVDAAGLPATDDTLTVNEMEMKHKLKSGSVMWTKKADVEWDGKSVASLYSLPDFATMMQEMARNAVVCIKEDQEYDLTDPVIQLLSERGENGATFKQIQNHTGDKDKDLVAKLSQLETINTVKRVGANNNVLVLVKFIKNWALKIDDKYLIVTPWLNLDFEVRYDIFFSWAGVIVNKIFESPGCSVAFISDTFELVMGRAVQDICQFLADCDVIELKIIKCSEANLFGDEDEVPQTEEFNPYVAMDTIVAFPVKNVITKYVHLRKVMLEYYQDKSTE